MLYKPHWRKNDHLIFVLFPSSAVQPEEAKRNSAMFNMLFVNGSHTLSPYIYSLNNKYGHLPDEERNGIKEKLDPSARLAKLYQNHGFSR
jgi:hypothetical protein